MATAFVYRCAECGDTTPIPEGAVTTQSEVPRACRSGHVDSWQVQPVAVRTVRDEERLAAIQEARTAAEEATAHLRRLVVLAVYAQVPLRDIATAAGVSPQTPANWAKPE